MLQYIIYWEAWRVTMVAKRHFIAASTKVFKPLPFPFSGFSTSPFQFRLVPTHLLEIGVNINTRSTWDFLSSCGF